MLSIAAIALFLGSCGSSEQAASPPSQSPTATQPPQPKPSPTPAATPNAQTPSPTKASPSTTAVTGLIPSTNANQRRQKIAQGRKDPFSFVPVQPQLKTLPMPPASPGAIPQPSPQGTGANPPIGNLPQQPKTTTPPLPPQPELAQGVAIAGIIDVGGAPKIIVKAPGERVSRYVQVGDYLSNGQVLVKRIEKYQSPSPVVVLEELGQEVYKEVGEGMAQEPSKLTQQPSLTNGAGETMAMMPQL
ncbi:MAG: hypothetical protein HC763_00490 [Hydrococcus sp. CRU_1_1]|nr:hypothetical protein [Hydrococcus sp. CRU_1_1]